MAALDTNVLVRAIVRDDAAQLAAAARLIRHAVATQQPLFIAATVVLELEWVLRSTFAFSKGDVVDTLAALIEADGFAVESEAALELALMHYQTTSADFADCLHAALSHEAGEVPMWTFDRKAAKVPGAHLLAA